MTEWKFTKIKTTYTVPEIEFKEPDWGKKFKNIFERMESRRKKNFLLIALSMFCFGSSLGVIFGKFILANFSELTVMIPVSVAMIVGFVSLGIIIKTNSEE